MGKESVGLDTGPIQEATGRRPETGPMVFGDDWTGVFVRGDNAYGYAQALRDLLAKVEGGAPLDYLWGMVALLESSHMGRKPLGVVTQEMVEYGQAHVRGKSQLVLWHEVGVQLQRK